MGQIKHTSDQSFNNDIADTGKPVLVDFWAPWCAPCMMLGPELEAYASEAGDKIDVMKMNTDENPVVAGSLGIRGIPTMILFNGGKEVHRIVGLRDRNMLKAELSSFVN